MTESCPATIALTDRGLLGTAGKKERGLPYPIGLCECGVGIVIYSYLVKYESCVEQMPLLNFMYAQIEKKTFPLKLFAIIIISSFFVNKCGAIL